jgi:hypothetical protein
MERKCWPWQLRGNIEQNVYAKPNVRDSMWSPAGYLINRGKFWANIKLWKILSAEDKVVLLERVREKSEPRIVYGNGRKYSNYRSWFIM